MQLGSQTIVPGKTGLFNAPTTGLKGLIISNESPYNISVTVGAGNQKTLYPETVDFFATGPGFNGNVTYVSSGVLTNPTSYTASTISFDAVGANEQIDVSVYPLSLTRQAVNPTATGQPIFSATYGNGNTVNANEILCVFNPANSGVIMTFHSARCFDSNSNTDSINLQYHQGSDLNFPLSIPAVSHSGIVNPPLSVAHCTAADTASFPGGDTDIEIHNTQQNVTVDLLAFPDSYILYPGGCLYIALSQTSTGHIVRLTLKWTENVLTPPQIVQGLTALASIVKNDGNAASTQWVEVTPSGQSASSVVGTVDGGLTWQVVQSGVYHQALHIQPSGNPLQLGQAGDIVEFLGQGLFDQLLTLVGNLVAGGGINVNTIRDNITGTQQIILTTTGISILNPLQTTLKLVSGSLSRIWVSGALAIAVAGTSVAHGLGTTPDFVIGTLDEGAAGSGVIGINYGTMSSTNFTAYCSVASTCRFIAMKQ